VERRLSFWALVAFALILGLLFVYMILPFLSSLFFAAVLALLAHPFHEKMARLLGGRRRAATLVSVFILLICLLALSLVIVVTGRELMLIGEELTESEIEIPQIGERLTNFVHRFFPGVEWIDLRNSFSQAVQSTTQEVFTRTRQFLSDIFTFAIGLAIMGLSLYYFLSEGPLLQKKLHQLSPLEVSEESILLDQFGRVCRGLVLGTLLCALAQAALLAVGLWIAGVERIWVLTGLTFLFSMIPFLGSAGVWVPVTGWLLWQGHYGSAVFLGIYGAAVVSTSDNLIRAHVLHGSAQIHPLLALISALGGLKLVGLWGIFLGPIVAAMFYALLKILHDRLKSEINPQEAQGEVKPEPLASVHQD